VARSAGTFVQLVGKDQALHCCASLRVKCARSGGELPRYDRRGIEPDQQNVKIGKAGRNRWMGWRPSVRGTAMNPIDHPHGGGEGRTKGGRHP